MSDYTYPTEQDLINALMHAADWIDADTLSEEEFPDVRLQVCHGGWQLHVGPSDYDQDHRGVWGASTLPQAGMRRVVARDLIEQCKEMEAQDYE